MKIPFEEGEVPLSKTMFPFVGGVLPSLVLASEKIPSSSSLRRVLDEGDTPLCISIVSSKECTLRSPEVLSFVGEAVITFTEAPPGRQTSFFFAATISAAVGSRIFRPSTILPCDSRGVISTRGTTNSSSDDEAVVKL